MCVYFIYCVRIRDCNCGTVTVARYLRISTKRFRCERDTFDHIFHPHTRTGENNFSKTAPSPVTVPVNEFQGDSIYKASDRISSVLSNTRTRQLYSLIYFLN